MSDSKYIAIDVGAESGRVMVGQLADGRIRLAEAHRFGNASVRVLTRGAAMGSTLHWDILRLWQEIQTGLGKVAPHERFAGIGVDTWGVDFALLGEDGSLLGNPVCYRDARTVGMPEKVFARIAKEKVYGATGIQTMALNTLFQLAALTSSSGPMLPQARQLLFVPDLLCYWLTGRAANEYTIASTSQMLDARTRSWWQEILFAIGIPRSLFPEMIMPATAKSQWGTVQSAIGDSLSATGIPVLAVGSHDTASAVAAVPASGDDWLYLSSGTWSLMGAEVPQPVLTAQACRYNLTNEGGVGGKIRLLKNIAGLWLLQECRKAWARAGTELDYATLARLAEEAPPLTAIIDPDDAALAAPGDLGGAMPERIAAYCRRTNQPVPETPGQFARVILESLAASYARVKIMLQDVTGRRYTRLHIVGGGSQNVLLNQLAANATGLEVHAGPVEATALGNIISQAITTGQIDSLATGRQIIAQSHPPKLFTPRDTEKWAAFLR